MPGYTLLNQKSLSPPLPSGKGVRPNKQEIGFMDFIRELSDESFPFDESTSLRIIGLEEVLISARPKMREKMLEFRRILQKAANNLTSRNCGDIQVVFRQPLLLGEWLVVEHVTAQIDIHHLFGNVQRVDINGQPVYQTGSFTLSN